MCVICNEPENEAINCSWCSGTGVSVNKISKEQTLCIRCGEARVLICATKLTKGNINHTNIERN
jgi:hypothetical protein